MLKGNFMSNNSEIRTQNDILMLENLTNRISGKDERIKISLLGYHFEEKDWSIEKKSKFIESILLGLPIAHFYFDGSNYKDWAIVDGRKRLNAIYEFISEKSFKLKGLTLLKDLENKNAHGIEYWRLRYLLETKVEIFILYTGSHRYLEFDFFKRFSTYSEQKIRHIIGKGKPDELLSTLAQNENLRNILSKTKIKNYFFERSELVLKYLMYYSYDAEETSNNTAYQLDEQVGRIASFEENRTKELETQINDFCKFLEQKKNLPNLLLTKNLFIISMLLFHRKETKHLENKLNKRDKEQYTQIKKNIYDNLFKA